MSAKESVVTETFYTEDGREVVAAEVARGLAAQLAESEAARATLAERVNRLTSQETCCMFSADRRLPKGARELRDLLEGHLYSYGLGREPQRAALELAVRRLNLHLDRQVD